MSENEPYSVFQLMASSSADLVLDKFCDYGSQARYREAKELLEKRGKDKLVRRMNISLSDEESLLSEYERIAKFKKRYLREGRRFDLYHGYEGEIQAQIWEFIPASEAALVQAQDIVDNTPISPSPRYLQWRRPFPFNFQAEESK